VWLSIFATILVSDIVFHLWQLWINPNISVVDTNISVLSGLRVAMIVTKAPSEPWSVVKNTLEHMMNQDIAHAYDVWLADEDVSVETAEWCAEHGVFVSCRKGVDGYHNVDWPRRRRCKEGNLMYFYDKIGYEQYDVVFQFDSDHAPSPSYLSNSLPAFADPKVSYIAMPNIAEKGSWVSNARLTHEAWYYGPSQLSFSYDHLPMMTGSHYAVRTSALKAIGGIAPELDEDMNTTFMMASHGKQGVYAGNAFAHGEGPMSLEDAAKQEFQWGKSACISFFRWRHILYPRDTKMRLTEKMRFYQVQLWYFIQVWFSFYIWFSLAPVASFGSWCTRDKCSLTFGSLLVYSTPVLFAHIGYNIFVRRNGWLRPGEVPFVSPDLFVYRALRPMWNAIGICAGIIEMVFSVVPSFSVTRKGESSTMPLGVFTLWYFHLIALYYIAFIATELFVHDGNVPIMLLVMYAAVVSLIFYITFRHFQDQKFKSLTWANPIGHLLVNGILVGVLVAACVLCSDRIFTSENAHVFIPEFAHSWQMWAVIGANAGAIVWGIIIALC
jgi:cellulose synthase/poly-beta-1,6-N-acetylglucosamine synthase-like glycosyltransferase